ncbi:hypothetical protein AVEN_471-1 [Araneus ventricosus]|uniref:Uncharacterized protein n=1 Tax=Araneus ventricosus TaxID=182803 RepID=A0A4Y2UHD4_ARAVE|nr:hypothetical protein AVEN_471-1 [Araneus ventricosus]
MTEYRKSLSIDSPDAIAIELFILIKQSAYEALRSENPPMILLAHFQKAGPTGGTSTDRQITVTKDDYLCNFQDHAVSVQPCRSQSLST